jgi:hypothetical protein
LCNVLLDPCCEYSSRFYAVPLIALSSNSDVSVLFLGIGT